MNSSIGFHVNSSLVVSQRLTKQCSSAEMCTRSAPSKFTSKYNYNKRSKYDHDVGFIQNGVVVKSQFIGESVGLLGGLESDLITDVGHCLNRNGSRSKITCGIQSKIAARMRAIPTVWLWFVPFVIVVAIVYGILMNWPEIAAKLGSKNRSAVDVMKQNLAKLPSIDGLYSVKLSAMDSEMKARPEYDTEILNVEGKRASVAIFNGLATEFGVIDSKAAEKGLAWYGHFVKEAKENPGSHPNIDLLFSVIEKDLTLFVDVVPE
eukprot:CAMPEP_0182442458 /NCGR_PEP_ID=MMETSP1172-20130603/1373_1 /TAXON_ID=708627 /ORGANISM="Timspurckia oligopyrenoides, Strain CCMP3278" /LENGTH=262 /DNA_ID=CAMNT_0024637327 /DNA_START=66 /DNA_END=854 /DNA_ORIENTATION=-